MDPRFIKETDIVIDNISLKGELVIPVNSDAIIIFSHGSGSSRFSKRNQFVAAYLHKKNFGTLLFDLLTEEEDQEYSNRFNIDLLTRRLIGATKWLQDVPEARDYPICYFGASTGAASALKAAAAALPQISAIVSRGGRPDLAMQDLSGVKAATLLLVGSKDEEVLQLNRKAYLKLNCEKELDVIQGASHLFEEQGTMSQVCERAAAWFEKYYHGVVTSN